MPFDFTQINIEKFKTNEACLSFISGLKWAEGYTCRKCGNTNYCRGKSPYSRRCTRCKHEESATANTLFHRCHIPIREAFLIAYTVCHDPDISSYALSRQLERRQMTCWKLKSRLMECLKNRGQIDVLYKEENRDKPRG